MDDYYVTASMVFVVCDSNILLLNTHWLEICFMVWPGHVVSFLIALSFGKDNVT